MFENFMENKQINTLTPCISKQQLLDMDPRMDFLLAIP